MSLLDIYNQALGVVGARGSLSSTGGNSREAELCNLLFPLARDEAFSAAYWPSLHATARLALVSEASGEWTSDQPSPGWGYAYALPANHIRPRYLTSFAPFALETIGDAMTIQTNDSSPILVYTRLVESTERWETLLRSLVVAVLGLKLAPAMRVDATTMRNAMINFQTTYDMALSFQANLPINQMPDHVPDWIAAREGTRSPLTSQFLFPSQAIHYAYS